MDKFFRLNSSRKLFVLILFAVFSLMLVCNHATDLVADDYRYCFSYADGSRIESLSQIPDSMASHRHIMNGRVAAHFLVQLFLIPPKEVFELVNALLFVALILLILGISDERRQPDNLLLLCIFGCLWILQPDFGQVFLWLTGSINYLWCAVFSLLWILPWVQHYRKGRSPSGLLRIFFPVYSFFTGAYSENSTVALVAMALVFLLLSVLEHRKRPDGWMLLSLAAVLAGFLYMMLAPAESANKSAEMRLPVLFANFLETGQYYLRFWPLLVSFCLFLITSLRKKLDRRLVVLSLVYLFGSLSGHFVLSFAMYTSGRSTYIGLILLIAANAVLFVPLLESRAKTLSLLLCAFCLAVSAFMVVTGVKDILRTHSLLRYNEEFIVSCAADGEREIEVPRPYARTKYSALEGLAYLNTEDPDDWPNVYMAKYFGVDRIIGV